MIILKWMNQGESCRLDSNGSSQDAVTSSCEHGNELSDVTKGKEFLYQPSDHRLLKDSAPYSLGVTVLPTFISILLHLFQLLNYILMQFCVTNNPFIGKSHYQPVCASALLPY
jgi:hypothetical protein